MGEGPGNYTHQALSCELRLLTSISNGLGGMREAITISKKLKNRVLGPPPEAGNRLEVLKKTRLGYFFGLSEVGQK